VTWTRLPATWQPRLPAAAFAVFAASCGVLAWLTRTGEWPWQASALLVVAGAAHGTGFDALVHRTAASVPARQAASFSGVLATVNQVAIVTGIAVSGTIYLVTRMTVVLFVLGLVQAIAGLTTAIAGKQVAVRGTEARSV
jgi:predicted MFS family arabinose efflux permease